MTQLASQYMVEYIVKLRSQQCCETHETDASQGRMKPIITIRVKDSMKPIKRLRAKRGMKTIFHMRVKQTMKPIENLRANEYTKPRQSCES